MAPERAAAAGLAPQGGLWLVGVEGRPVKRGLGRLLLLVELPGNYRRRVGGFRHHHKMAVRTLVAHEAAVMTLKGLIRIILLLERLARGGVLLGRLFLRGNGGTVWTSLVEFTPAVKVFSTAGRLPAAA